MKKGARIFLNVVLGFVLLLALYFIAAGAQRCSVIRSSFAGTTAQRYVKAGNGYGASDVFYEARGCYSAFCTCNTWTGSTLRSAGIRMASWTPFVKSVFYQLPLPTKP